jgi:hypothetical protein
MSTFTFDTHSFIKAFIAAKTEELKAEVIAKTIIEIREENLSKIENKFEESTNEIVTKNDLLITKQELEYKIELLRQDIIIKLGTMMIAGFIASTTILIAVLPLLINKH